MCIRDSGNYVGQAVNYIESNDSQPMRVQDIASGLGLNRSYFCRLFRQQTGLSPQEYIVSCRLAKAAQFMTCLLYTSYLAVRVHLVDGVHHRVRHAAGNRTPAAVGGGLHQLGPGGHFGELDGLRLKHAHHFFKCEHEVHVAADLSLIHI